MIIKNVGKKCLRYNQYEFPLFTAMDQPKQFYENEFQAGVYHAEADYSYFPMRGNGWYSQPMIEFCVRQHYIKKNKTLNMH
jgi:hypothetical protein